MPLQRVILAVVTHPNYFRDTFRGQAVYRCVKCRYDSMDLATIKGHARIHPFSELPETDIDLTKWIAQMQQHQPAGLPRIGIALLTWNQAEPAFSAAGSIFSECHRLRALGLPEPKVFWSDNGSEDGTIQAVIDRFQQNRGLDFQATMFPENVGQSIARNKMIHNFLESDCEYLLMVDGDIELIPYSTFALAKYLKFSSRGVGCIGLDSRNCCYFLDQNIARDCRKIEPWMSTPVPKIAWTQYGMFRRSVLERCRFDEAPCFQGPGWGFEDDDLYLQMEQANFTSWNTPYFRYLHRRRNSSLKQIDQNLAAKVFNSRLQYLRRKWPKANLAGNLPVLDY